MTTNNEFVEKLAVLHNRESWNEFENVYYQYCLQNSTPFSPDAQGSMARLYQRIIDRVGNIGFIVRKVTPNFLWMDGEHDSSSLGKMLVRKNGGCILLDEAGPNTIQLQLFDTCVHECIHATGLPLKRFTKKTQPQMRDRDTAAYWQEEMVAIVGSMMVISKTDLYDHIDRAAMEAEYQRIVAELVGKGVNAEHGMERAREAARWLLSI